MSKSVTTTKIIRQPFIRQPRVELVGIAVAIAKDHGLDPALVCSICCHESGYWNPWAIRYEGAFYSRYIQPMKRVEVYGRHVSEGTERQLRATSFGLMQVMGQTAREQGFRGEYLTELLDPALSCEFGCRRLKLAIERTHGDVRKALLNYNGGTYKRYPDLVLRHYQEYEEYKSDETLNVGASSQPEDSKRSSS